MCFHPARATASHRRLLRRRQAPTLPPLALLDLSKPGERQAHDFLVRATSGRDRMWELKAVRRQADWLLCVVRWLALNRDAQQFSLATVSLTEFAVCWQDCDSVEEARTKMNLHQRKPVR